jgi:Flp pilus assembly protein TadD
VDGALVRGMPFWLLLESYGKLSIVSCTHSQKWRRRIARTLIFLTTLPASAYAYQASVADLRAMTADASRSITLSQFPQAEQELREIIALAPETTEAHYLLGYTLFRANERVNRSRSTRSLLDCVCQHRRSLVVVASDYVLLSDMPDAEKWLLYATERQPANASTWYLVPGPADAVQP